MQAWRQGEKLCSVCNDRAMFRTDCSDIVQQSIQHPASVLTVGGNTNWHQSCLTLEVTLISGMTRIPPYTTFPDTIREISMYASISELYKIVHILKYDYPKSLLSQRNAHTTPHNKGCLECDGHLSTF